MRTSYKDGGQYAKENESNLYAAEHGGRILSAKNLELATTSDTNTFDNCGSLNLETWPIHSCIYNPFLCIAPTTVEFSAFDEVFR